MAVADIQEASKKGIYHDTDLTTSTVEEIEKLGGKGIFVQTDVSDDEAVRNLIERTVSEFGTLDILINNAGITIPGGIEETTIADYDTVMGVNLRALYVASKLAMPHLKKPSGRIIHIASVQSLWRGRRTCVCRIKSRRRQPHARHRPGIGPLWRNRQRDLPGLHRNAHTGLSHTTGHRRLPGKNPTAPPGLAIGHRQRRGILRIGRRRLDHRHSPARGWRMDGVYFLIASERF